MWHIWLVLLCIGVTVASTQYRNGPYHPSYRGPYVSLAVGYPIIYPGNPSVRSSLLQNFALKYALNTLIPVIPRGLGDGGRQLQRNRGRQDGDECLLLPAEIQRSRRVEVAYQRTDERASQGA